MSERRCNQCKVKFGGRKAGRTHGEETGHEWQPMVACLACHSAFKKQKLYKAHLPSCTARPMVPNRSLPCKTPIINIPPSANVSGNLVDSESDAVFPAALVNGNSISLTKVCIFSVETCSLEILIDPVVYALPRADSGRGPFHQMLRNFLANAQPPGSPPPVSLQTAVADSTVQEESRSEPVEDITRRAMDMR